MLLKSAREITLNLAVYVTKASSEHLHGRIAWSPSLHSSVGTRKGLENRKSLARSPARRVFFLRIDDSHFGRIRRLLLFRRCLCGKAASGLEMVLCGVLVKRIPGSMDKCSDRGDITEITLKTALSNMQSITQSTWIGNVRV